jgi:SWI/SNF-related matrix-associated actin-dependent regulator of chromatin subfamily D
MPQHMGGRGTPGSNVSGGARRGPGPMVTNNAAAQAMNHQQLAMQQQAIAHEREMAKRRSRKPTDLNISEEIQELVPNGDMYSKIRDFERRMDATVMRKRLDVQEAARNYKVGL